jgi:hypothetical protein
MALNLIGSIAALLLWIVFAIVVPLGPAGVAIHLLLGASAALFVRWWALKYRG